MSDLTCGHQVPYPASNVSGVVLLQFTVHGSPFTVYRSRFMVEQATCVPMFIEVDAGVLTVGR